MGRRATRIEDQTSKAEVTQIIELVESTDGDEPYVAAPVPVPAHPDDRNLQLRLLSQQLRAHAGELREQSRIIRARSAEVRKVAKGLRLAGDPTQGHAPTDNTRPV